MKTCDELVIGWYPGKLPPYQVKFTTAPEAVVNVKTPATTAAAAATATTTVVDPDPERKVKPLKIKKAAISGNFSTPSPMLQRESREWKPSSQFFKPLNSGMHLPTCTLKVR